MLLGKLNILAGEGVTVPADGVIQPGKGNIRMG